MFRRFPVLLGLVLLMLGIIAGPVLEASTSTQVGANVQRLSDPKFTFGLHVKDDSFFELARAEQKLGRKADIFSQYGMIEGRFNAKRAELLASNGYLIVMTLEFWAKQYPDERFSLRQISSGAFDADIDRWAKDLKAFERPLIVRPLHEINSSWYPWGAYAPGNSVEDFVPAWRHIVDRFRKANASNVQFELCFARFNEGIEAEPQKSKQVIANPWIRLWPGDSYVDIVGMDVFNRTPKDGSKWRAFDDLFGRSYQHATSLSKKPLWIQEMASTGVGGSKAAWIEDAFNSIMTRYPRVTSVTWFNHSVKKSTDWDFDQTPESLQALRFALGH